MSEKWKNADRVAGLVVKEPPTQGRVIIYSAIFSGVASLILRSPRTSILQGDDTLAVVTKLSMRAFAVLLMFMAAMGIYNSFTRPGPPSKSPSLHKSEELSTSPLSPSPLSPSPLSPLSF